MECEYLVVWILRWDNQQRSPKWDRNIEQGSQPGLAVAHHHAEAANGSEGTQFHWHSMGGESAFEDLVYCSSAMEMTDSYAARLEKKGLALVMG